LGFYLFIESNFNKIIGGLPPIILIALLSVQRVNKKSLTELLKSIFERNIVVTNVMLTKIDKYRIHIIIWFIYIFYYLLFYSISTNTNINIALIFKVLLSNIFYAITFYFSSEIVFPLLLKNLNMRIIKFLSSIFICLLLTFILVLIKLFLFRFASNTIIPTLGKVDIREEFVLHFWNNQIYIFYALGYHFAQRVIQQQKELTKKDLELAEEKAKTAILEKEKSQAELAFLRSQINPHFMFNTLNMIYNRVRKANKEAGEIVIEFANMMRYATSTKLQADEVDVRGELDFVKEYLNIHKLRFRNAIYIDYDEEGYMLSHRIVPMVLITLVENAVKHGSIDDPNFPLIIRASLIDDYFSFMVHNLKNLKPSDLDQKGNTGVGIVNIEKRLAAVYKNGGYSLEKEETDEDYIVTFTVNFKETKR
jgi:two-component system, LytTR family, sensor kinase